MHTALTTPTFRPVGQFPLRVAFGVARDLEHAGITTVVSSHGDEYQVTVQADQYDRALRRI